MKLKNLYIIAVVFVLMFSVCAIAEPKGLSFGEKRSFSGVSELNDALENDFKTSMKSTDKPSSGQKTTKISFDLDSDDISLLDLPDADYKFLAVEGFGTTSTSGEPMLPMKTIKLTLPKGSTGISVSVDTGKYYEINEKIKIVPVAEAASWKDIKENEKKNAGEHKPSKKVYSSDDFYPGELATFDSGSDNDNTYVFVRIYPIQYIPSEQKAVAFTKLDIEVSYSEYDANATSGSSGGSSGGGLAPGIYSTTAESIIIPVNINTF